jgi:DNA invertase Pin-like site-specific DNA recombinase
VASITSQRRGINVVTRPKAYSYIRMSTADQAKGDSARRQDKATRDYAEEHNLELAQILIDEGVSAFTGSNAEFGKLGSFIALAEDGKIERGSFLIVESLDRISRQNVFQAMGLLEKIINLDINIVTLSDKKIYSRKSGTDSQSDLIFAIFTLIRAHEESQLKSIRLRASWDNKRNLAREGKNTRHVIPKWLRYSECGNIIESIPERAAIIEQIFELCHSGWGAYSIAKNLNDKGLETWGRAKFWQESYIKKIIHNRAVMGEYQPHTLERSAAKSQRSKIGDPVQNYYPQIISSHMFFECQSAMAQRSQNGRGRKGSSLSNLFSGLLFCYKCGGGMRFVDKGSPPKGGKYLRCTRSILTTECNSQSYRYVEIENLIINVLKQMDTKKIRLDSGYLELSSQLMNRASDLKDQISSITSKLNDLVKLVGLHPIDEISNSIRELSTERQNKELEFETINKSLDEIKIPDFDMNREISDLLERNYQSDDEVKSVRMKISGIIRELVTKITISQEEVHPWEFTNSDEKSGKFINLRIQYRNGASQVWYGKDGSNLYMESSEKMNLLKQKIALERRE